MRWMPLPWWMSQSTTSTRRQPRCSRACAAAMATVFKTQKPIAMCASAWWPGGRTSAMPLRARPETTALVTSMTAPAAQRAASIECELM